MADNGTKAESRSSADKLAPADDEQLPKEKRIRHLKLYRAALTANWDVAKGTYDQYKDDISVRISKEGDTALHIAAAAKHIDFVKELVERMDGEDLALENDVGNTAFCLAAASGKVDLAKVMMEKNAALAMIREGNNKLPLHMAALLGHKEMVKYLYQKTKNALDDKDRADLLVTLINTSLYDVALDLLRDYPELAIARHENKETALHALARKPLVSSNFPNRIQQGILGRFLHLVSGAKHYNKKLQAEALELVEALWKEVVLLSDKEISKLIAYPKRLIFVAAEQGNTQFLCVLIREYPDLIFKVDENQYSIFHIAVKTRQEEIFKLIYEIGSLKDLIVMTEDNKKNNILHLAGLLAPPNRISIVSGAALQMQRELLWFEEVEKVVQGQFAEAKNRKGLTPRALFTKEHKDLREAGEKWMKDTATSCMVVATLIATVVFAAAFTVPGSNRDGTGLPFFLEKLSFKIFAISDAVSLVASSTSIVNFLSILTSRYAEEDFLRLLPRKLLLGLATLFISIAAMMVVFSTTFFIFFNHGRLWIAILVTALASTPVVMFIWQHFLLFYDVLRSTLVSDSLFQLGKTSLFRKEGEAGGHQKHAKTFSGRLAISCTGSTNV